MELYVVTDRMRQEDAHVRVVERNTDNMVVRTKSTVNVENMTRIRESLDTTTPCITAN